LVCNLSAFTTLFALGKSWDNMHSTASPFTEFRLAHLARNKCVGFQVVEQIGMVHHTLLSLEPFLLCGLRIEWKIVEIIFVMVKYVYFDIHEEHTFFLYFLHISLFSSYDKGRKT
jgi:hypothetical protein